jgi:hypothetical protein
MRIQKAVSGHAEAAFFMGNGAAFSRAEQFKDDTSDGRGLDGVLVISLGFVVNKQRNACF